MQLNSGETICGESRSRRLITLQISTKYPLFSAIVERSSHSSDRYNLWPRLVSIATNANFCEFNFVDILKKDVFHFAVIDFEIGYDHEQSSSRL